MAPQVVNPSVKSNNNDTWDAAGMSAAVTRPPLRFVPPKARAPQDLLALHRVRDGLPKGGAQCRHAVVGTRKAEQATLPS